MKTHTCILFWISSNLLFHLLTWILLLIWINLLRTVILIQYSTPFYNIQYYWLHVLSKTAQLWAYIQRPASKLSWFRRRFLSVFKYFFLCVCVCFMSLFFFFYDMGVAAILVNGLWVMTIWTNFHSLILIRLFTGLWIFLDIFYTNLDSSWPNSYRKF